MSEHGGSTKVIIYALLANAAIAASKYVAAFLTSSGSMLAEAVHSTADVGNQLLLLLGLRLSKRPPSDHYPLGYGKESYFWSFLVGIMLFSIGGLFSLYEGIHKLFEPSELSYPFIALGVLIFGIIVEGISMNSCLKEVKRIKGNKTYTQWFLTSRNSELVVIFGEDFAALAGLITAFFAVLASHITGNLIYDAFGSIAIGVLLIFVAIFICINVKRMLIGQSVEPEIKESMLAHLNSDPRIKKVFNLLTLQLGSHYMVSIKAEMAPQGSESKLIESINAIEKKFRETYSDTIWLFFEPDIKD